MPDPTSVPLGVDPSQYADYFKAQRQAALAQALMQSALTPPQVENPQAVHGLYVQPRVGAVSALSKLAEALVGKKLTDQSLNSQAQLAQTLNQPYVPGGQQTSPGTPLQAVPPTATPGQTNDPNEQGPTPLIARNPGQSLAQTVQQTQPQYSPPNPRNPMGLPADVVRQMAMTNPAEYAKMLLGPEAVQIGRIAGVDPRTAATAAYNKANGISLRGGEMVQLPDGRVIRNPTLATGEMPLTDAQGNITGTYTLPGHVADQAALAGAVEGAKNVNTPHYEPDPFRPGQFTAAYPPTPPALANAPQGAAGAQARTPQAASSGNSGSGGSGGTRADLEAQIEGAKSGQDYATELAKNATGATEVRRSLSELKNLAAQSTPSAMNEGKMRLGSYMVAAGVSPETTANWLGVDVGALQAAQKQTATLAVNTIHSMTSRGTNFDLDTFMRNNPNLNMADPAAFSRVVDYMDNKAKQEVLKQKDFAQWKKGVSPADWETGHTAHWLDLQNQNIDAGRSNSRPPLSSFWRPDP